MKLMLLFSSSSQSQGLKLENWQPVNIFVESVSAQHDAK